MGEGPGEGESIMATELSYWNRRVSRRGAVVLGGGALGAFLVACRGGKNSSSSAGTSGTALSGQAQLGNGTQAAGTAAAQAGQESPYELVAKYSWRKLKWGGTPTRGGEIIHGG